MSQLKSPEQLRQDAARCLKIADEVDSPIDSEKLARYAMLLLAEAERHQKQRPRSSAAAE